MKCPNVWSQWVRGNKDSVLFESPSDEPDRVRRDRQPLYNQLAEGRIWLLLMDTKNVRVDISSSILTTLQSEIEGG